MLFYEQTHQNNLGNILKLQIPGSYPGESQFNKSIMAQDLYIYILRFLLT